MGNKYYPLLKTTISEMRALENLEVSVLNKTTPILELTRSRRTSKDKVGNIYKKAEKIKEIISDNEFIIDITSYQDLSNEQIESLFDEGDGFENWCFFIRDLYEKYSLKAIPVVLSYEDTDIDIIETQINELAKISNKIAVRVSTSDVIQTVIDNIASVVEHVDINVIVIVDAGYVSSHNFDDKLAEAQYAVRLMTHHFPSSELVLVSSSFPSNVAGEGEDHTGIFDILEFKYFEAIKGSIHTIDLSYGDYGLIHPERNENIAYGWVPRIDFASMYTCRYHRYRRDVGGYLKCAKVMVDDDFFKKNKIDCWGVKNITSAAQGERVGMSPSFWISVRSNIHMTRVVDHIAKP